MTMHGMIPNVAILEGGGGKFRWCDARDSDDEELIEDEAPGLADGYAEDEVPPPPADNDDADSELGWCTDDDHGYEWVPQAAPCRGRREQALGTQWNPGPSPYERPPLSRVAAALASGDAPSLVPPCVAKTRVEYDWDSRENLDGGAVP